MLARCLTVLAAALAVALASCGSSSPPAARSGGPAATTPAGPPATTTPSTAPRRHRPAPGAQSAPSTPTGSTDATGGTPAPSTRSGAAGLTGARAIVAGHGYRVADPGTYRSDQTLRVLMGIRQGSAGTRVQQAFFFSGGRYLGTDTSEPSASVSVAAQDDTSVTLRYGLYRPGDRACCPSGGSARVRFALDNGRLSPMDPVPSAAPGAARSRR